VSAPTPLEEEIRGLIAAEGPLPLADYMRLCLTHPRHGYYGTRDPFGAAGDFTTAPEVSQMFGELIGVWAVAMWQRMGAPQRFALIELGPGRGTLMADALRAARIVPVFRAAAEIHLVETSPALRAMQARALAAGDATATWHDDLSSVPDAPAIAIANEFLDALPVRQAVRGAKGWHERVVGFDERGRLAFGLAPAPLPGFELMLPAALQRAPEGAVFEWREEGSAVAPLCERLVRCGGAALMIDYGHAEPGLGDTFQALRAHAFADPLDQPGEADLTAHVDFAAVAAAGRRLGVHAAGPMTQGDFLRALGIEARAAALRQRATPAQAQAIDAALTRLTGSGRANMGELFKVLAFLGPGLEGGGLVL